RHRTGGAGATHAAPAGHARAGRPAAGNAPVLGQRGRGPAAWLVRGRRTLGRHVDDRRLAGLGDRCREALRWPATPAASIPAPRTHTCAATAGWHAGWSASGRFRRIRAGDAASIPSTPLH